jgi:hypothetical protein
MVVREKTVLLVDWKLTGRRALVGVVLLALVVMLATRTLHLTITHVVTVRSGAAQAMRQHLNRDAARWIPPSSVLTALRAPTFYPHVAPAGAPLGVLLLEKSLYDRPHPSC